MMRKAGGRVNKQDGGPVSEYLRDEGRKAGMKGAVSGMLAVPKGIAATVPGMPMTLRGIAAASAAKDVADAGAGMTKRSEMMSAADKFDKTGLPGRPKSERASGGRVMHDDAKADKSMVAKGVHKHEAKMHPGKPMTKLNTGGKVVTAKALVAEKGYQGGGGGGVGRMEKEKSYGKKK